jgi:hypothetical protein
MKEYDFPSPEVQEIYDRLKARIQENPDEVIATLESVVSGELALVETVTDEEAERFLKYCEQILEQVAPKNSNSTSEEITGESISKSFSGAGNPFIDIEIDDVRQGLMLMSYFFYDDFHYPQPATSKYDISNDPFEKMKWFYRL